MTLQIAFQELTAKLRTLTEVMQALHLLVVEDKPRANDAALVDILEDATHDLLSTLQISSAAATTAYHCVARQQDLVCLLSPLTTCQTHFYQMEGQLAELFSYGRIAPLIQLGRERSGEWPLWTRSVRKALESTQEPVYEAKNALSRCWQEALANATNQTATVTNTAIGIQLQPATVTPQAGKRSETRRA